jgi:hypothetical protein
VIVLLQLVALAIVDTASASIRIDMYRVSFVFRFLKEQKLRFVDGMHTERAVVSLLNLKVV